MALPDEEWISCAATQRLLESIALSEGCAAGPLYTSLLELAAEGLVRCRAAPIRQQPVYSRPDGSDDYDLLDPANLPSLNGLLIFNGLKRLHEGHQEEGEFACMQTGTFKFGQVEIYREAGERKLISARVHIFGLRFNKADVLMRFGVQDSRGEAPHSSSEGGKKSRAGQGSFARLDEPFLIEMQQLIDSGKATTAHGAARMIAHRAPGNAVEESKVHRLADRFRSRQRGGE